METDWEESFVAGNERPLILEGIYDAKCIKIEKGYYLGFKKIFFHFKIFDWMNSDKNPVLFMAMNDPGKKVSAGTKYYQNWVIANGNKAPGRKDRMSSKIFLNGMFEVYVETVKPKFPDGEEKPECFHYSIIRFIKRRVTDAN